MSGMTDENIVMEKIKELNADLNRDSFLIKEGNTGYMDWGGRASLLVPPLVEDLDVLDFPFWEIEIEEWWNHTFGYSHSFIYNNATNVVFEHNENWFDPWHNLDENQWYTIYNPPRRNIILSRQIKETKITLKSHVFIKHVTQWKGESGIYYVSLFSDPALKIPEFAVANRSQITQKMADEVLTQNINSCRNEYIIHNCAFCRNICNGRGEWFDKLED